MNSFCPTSGSEAEWKEARARLGAYLRALHLANEDQQERIISVVLQQAAVKHAQNLVESPTALAMNEIRDISEQWFAKLSESGERNCTMGFVLLFATDATKKWPAAFLATEIPADCQHALKESWVRAAPDLKFSSMVPQPFENPLQDALTLPAPLAELAKDKAPFLAKVFAIVVSWLSIWPGNRLR